LSIGARTPNCRWEGRRAREIGRGWTVNAATCAGVDGGVSSRATASGPPSRTPRRGRSPPTKTWRFAARRSRFGSETFAIPATVKKMLEGFVVAKQKLTVFSRFWREIREFIGLTCGKSLDFKMTTACVNERVKMLGNARRLLFNDSRN